MRQEFQTIRQFGLHNFQDSESSINMVKLVTSQESNFLISNPQQSEAGRQGQSIMKH